MRPTYDELIQLNPHLKHKSYEDLEALMNAIEECGYGWDPTRKLFNNSTIGRGIRTEGLDIFTPEEVYETHLEIKKDITDFPKAERAKRLWAIWIMKLIGLTITWGLFSWIVVGWRIWLIGLLSFTAVIALFYYYCSRRWAKKQ